MLWFKHKKNRYVDIAEQRFQTIVELIKDLPRADYNRLIKGMGLAYNAYQEVRNVKTVDEKETADIDNIAKALEETGEIAA